MTSRIHRGARHEPGPKLFKRGYIGTVWIAYYTATRLCIGGFDHGSHRPQHGREDLLISYEGAGVAAVACSAEAISSGCFCVAVLIIRAQLFQVEMSRGQN